MSLTSSTRPRPARRAQSTRAGLAAVARDRGSRWLFFAGGSVITVGYTLLLPFAYTQRISPANWDYLTPEMGGFAAALGLGLAGVLTLQVYAARRIAARRAGTAGRGAAGVMALLTSLAPSLLCCTPIVPTLLATLGLSGMTLFATTGTLQYFFAAHETALLAGSLAFLLGTGWWSARRIARASCLTGHTCPTDTEHPTTSREP